MSDIKGVPDKLLAFNDQPASSEIEVPKINMEVCFASKAVDAMKKLVKGEGISLAENRYLSSYLKKALPVDKQKLENCALRACQKLLPKLEKSQLSPEKIAQVKTKIEDYKSRGSTMGALILLNTAINYSKDDPADMQAIFDEIIK